MKRLLRDIQPGKPGFLGVDALIYVLVLSGILVAVAVSLQNEYLRAAPSLVLNQPTL